MNLTLQNQGGRGVLCPNTLINKVFFQQINIVPILYDQSNCVISNTQLPSSYSIQIRFWLSTKGSIQCSFLCFAIRYLATILIQTAVRLQHSIISSATNL